MESLWKYIQFDLEYVEIGGEIWKILSFIITYTVSENWLKNTTTTVKRYVNGLGSRTTMGHSIEKMHQVIGHYWRPQ